MDIKDLKKTWSEFSDKSSERQKLTAEQIRSMLDGRTKSLLDRIDRNIRIGLVVLAGIITLSVIFDLVSAGESVPGWISAMDSSVNILIIALAYIFFLHYWKIRRQCREVGDLRHTLLKTIRVLTHYQRLFTLALAIIVLESATGFTAGYFTGINKHNISEGFLVPVLAIGIFLLALISGTLFLLLRWSFRKIYGTYLARLKETLAELDELE